MRGPLHLSLGVLLAVGWGLGMNNVLTGALLSAALPIKAVGVAWIVFPAGIVLGMFYPYCVSRLVESDQGQSVPMTYGLTTLSSVLGSAFAMTAIINMGFTNVIGLGCALYVAAALLSMAGPRRS